MKSYRLWLGLMVVFLAGILTGVIVAGLVLRHKVRQTIAGGPLVVRELVIHRLNTELNLSAAQEAQITPLLHAAHDQLLVLRLRHQPEIARIAADTIAQINPHLDAEQAARLAQLHERFRQRWELPEPNAPVPPPAP